MAIAALLLYLHICYCFIVDSMIVKSVVYNAMSMIQSGLRWDKDKLALAIQNGTGRRELLESIIGRWSPFDEFAKLNSLDEHWKATIESIQQDIDKLALAIPNGTKAKLALAIQNGSGPVIQIASNANEFLNESLGPRKRSIIKIFFVRCIQGALLSGLEAYTSNASDYNKLDNAIYLFGPGDD